MFLTTYFSNEGSCWEWGRGSEEFEDYSSNDTEEEDSDEEDDNGLRDIRWKLMLVRDDMNDLFKQNCKDMKHRACTRFDRLYN